MGAALVSTQSRGRMPPCIVCAATGWEYQMSRKIGSGSFGSVWQARCRKPKGKGSAESEVAMKFPRGAGVAEICQEIDIMRQLTHHGIVECLDVISELDIRASTPDTPGPCLVMRAADADLKRFLDNHAVIGESLAREWSTQLADAVAHMHFKRVVHRDIKPSNILVFFDTTTGTNGGFVKASVKLADFGMARRLPDANPAKRIRIKQKGPRDHAGRDVRGAFSMTARVCTLWYRAPEILAYHLSDEDSGPHACRYGTPADVWSYGAVVYEMLLGKPLARAVNSVDALSCLLGVLGPCFDAGTVAPEYAKQPRWHAAVKVASQHASRRRIMPSGPHWDVPRACLQWCPKQRGTAAAMSRMPWTIGSESSHSQLAEAPSGSSRVALASGNHSASLTRRLIPEVPGLSSHFLDLGRDWNHRTVASTDTCSCTGNCRKSAHRQAGGCDCKALVVGSTMCVDCICKVPECGKPRNKSDWCYGHRKAMENLSEAGKLAATTAQFAASLVPVDLTKFIDSFPKMQGDVALSIVIALTKEPTAVRAILEFDCGAVLAAGGCTGPVLHDAVFAAVLACASTPDSKPPHTHELEQLNRQGVARFMGLAATALALGVIVKTTDGVREGLQVVQLGLTRSTYSVTGESAMCCEFVRAVSAAGVVPPVPPHDAIGAVTELVRYAGFVRDMLKSVGGSVPIGTKRMKKGGYVGDFIVRKLCLGWLAVWSRASTPALSWADVPASRWRELTADSHEHVAELPSTWSSAQASAFVCGRPDWPFLTSMYLCLWKEVADHGGTDVRLTLDASSEVHATIASFRARHGFAPHPYVLARECGWTAAAPAG